MRLVTHTIEDRLTFVMQDNYFLQNLFSAVHNTAILPTEESLNQGKEDWIEIDWSEWYVDEVKVIPIPDGTRSTVEITISRVQDAPSEIRSPFNKITVSDA